MTRFASKTNGLETWSRTWEVSPKRPYSKPLPFKSEWRKENQYPGWVETRGEQINDLAYVRCNTMQLPSGVAGRARTAWVEKAKGGIAADLGLTVATWKSSLSMVSGAIRSLTKRAERAQLYYSKKSSSLYLEGIFGWVPLMQDIYNAYEVLSDLSPTANKTTVRIRDSRVRTLNESTIRGPLQSVIGVQVGGSLRCVNPNLGLLERLGLVNPAAIAWDAVPYSFVINWFIPVGGYLKSLSDMVGWEEQNTWTTTFVRKEFAGSVLYQDWDDDGKYKWGPRRVTIGSVNRGPGIPSREFPNVRLPTADLYKATVALALLDQKLRYPLTKAWRNRRHYTE